MNLQLENKRALVTGSNSGIGEAIAKALAAEGTAVVVHGRDETKTRRVADEITRSGSRAAVAIGDLASDVEAQRVVDAALAAFGSIDILVNNAGVFHVRGWWDTAPAQWIEIYNQNVGGSVRLVQALAPPMRDRRWGRIIQISPGPIMTPAIAKIGMKEQEQKQFIDRTLLKRWGRPEEVARLARFLLTDDSSFIVGEEIAIDGGRQLT
jgi:3-oxoacyl-[acyl-carrier protein] reductase